MYFAQTGWFEFSWSWEPEGRRTAADLKRLRRELRQKRELQRQLERQLEEESDAEPAAQVDQDSPELDLPKESSPLVHGNAFSSLREAAGKYIRLMRRTAAEVSDASSDESGPLLSTWQPDKHVSGLALVHVLLTENA